MKIQTQLRAMRVEQAQHKDRIRSAGAGHQQTSSSAPRKMGSHGWLEAISGKSFAEFLRKQWPI